MMRILHGLLMLPLLFAVHAQAQTVFYTDNFELNTGWTSTSSTLANNWIVGTCENNGGTHGAYISSGGTTFDCTPTGVEHYGYINAASASEQVILYKSIDATCFSSVQVLYDLKVTSETGQDVFDLVYSTNGGASWNAVTSGISGISAYAQQTNNLPAAVNFSTFLLGLRFTYNSTVVSGNPPAVDNLIVRGTSNDGTPPTPICPTTVNVYANLSCTAIVPDVSVSVTDNCTPSALITFTQNPPVGSFVSDTTIATITAFDATGNNTQCQTTFIFLDTIAPFINCPNTVTLYANSNCEATLGDYSSLALSTDNCNTAFVTQNTPAGTILTNGSHTIYLTTVDEFGNDRSCGFTVSVVDTIAPSVTCPNNATVYANSNCTAYVGTFVPQVSGTDNCFAFNQLIYAQSPAPTSTFSDSVLVTLQLTDPSGNTGSCQFYLHALDTISPIATCLNDTLVPISSGCNLTIPDLSGTAQITESCSALNALTFSQNPVAGTVVAGASTVTLFYTDEAGNTGSCLTEVLPLDNIAPAITCPPSSTLNNGNNCTAALPNLVGTAVATDNCSVASITQSPPANTMVSAGTTVVTLTAQDGFGNTASCTTQYTVIENVNPIITCPSSVTTCNPMVTYNLPSGQDNCAFAIVQTDLTGLTSGDQFPVGTTTLTYMAIDSSGNNATCSFNIQVLDYPDTTQISFDTLALCSVFNTTVNALPIQSGLGTWTSNSGNVVFTTPNSPTSAVTGLNYGNTLVYWTVNSTSCGFKRDSALIIVSQLPSVPNLLDTITVCEQDGGVIQTTIPVSGTGTWSSVSGISFNDSNSPITTLNNVNSGYSTVYWSVNTPGCIANTDSAIVYRPFTATIQLPDTTLCIEDLPVALIGTANGPNQTAVWTVLQGQIDLSSNYTANTSITSASAGVVIIGYKKSHPVCGSSSDTVVVSFLNCENAFDNIATLFTPNDDGNNDYFELGNLGSKYPNCQVTIINRWGSVVFESTGYSNPWDGRFNGEDVPIGTYFYEVSSPNNDFETFSGSISIIR